MHRYYIDTADILNMLTQTVQLLKMCPFNELSQPSFHSLLELSNSALTGELSGQSMDADIIGLVGYTERQTRAKLETFLY
jgi:hypothetical protein